MSDETGKVIELRPKQAEAEAQAEEASTSDELAAVREALDELRNEIRARFPAPRGVPGDGGEDADRSAESDPFLQAQGATADADALGSEAPRRPSPDERGTRDEADADDGESIDWLALFDELRARVGTLGMREHEGEVDEFGLDPSSLAAAIPLFEFLRERYWRVEVSGLENLPQDAPALFVANRSGILPYDAVMLAQVLERERPHWQRARFLVADWLASLPYLQPRLTRIGGVRACRENTDRLLASGRPVLAFPEGEKGAIKPFQDRYRVQRFARGGVVRAAFDNDVPLVPVGIVGAEETHPILWKTRRPAQWIGLPFLPLTPTFPLLGPLGLLPLPTKWRIHFGEPLALDALKDGVEAPELEVWRLNEELRDRIADLIDDGLEARASVWE